MTDRRISGWIVGPLLAAPLVVLTAWIAWGAANRSHDVSVRDLPAAPTSPAPAAPSPLAAAPTMPSAPAPAAPTPAATEPSAAVQGPVSPQPAVAPATTAGPARATAAANASTPSAPAAPATTAAATRPATVPDPAAAPGLPRPEADLPQDRLEERVDGAAAYLTSIGCRRLVYWRLPAPAADLELLLFDTPAGAAKALARDAGPDRTPGPGDEAQAAPQSIYFRRGPAYVRLLADPDAPAAPGALAPVAAKLDAYLAGAAK